MTTTKLVAIDWHSRMSYTAVMPITNRVLCVSLLALILHWSYSHAGRMYQQDVESKLCMKKKQSFCSCFLRLHNYY